MSDEEREAIQMIKNQKEEVDGALIAMEIPENYIGEDVEQEYLEWQKNADIILNLIEKQSKEIEELKEEQAKRQWVHIKENGEVEPLFYVSKDKIKAKIEDKESQINDIKDNLDYDEVMIKEVKRLENEIEVLQSLLEKE